MKINSTYAIIIVNTVGGDSLAANEFGAVFDSILAEVLADMSAQNKVIDQERFSVLESVCAGISDVIGNGTKADISIRPSFCSGGVSVRVPIVAIDSDGVKKLMDVLSVCDNFEVVPLTDGNVRISATVDHLFK